jgi:hypothetical protein
MSRVLAHGEGAGWPPGAWGQLNQRPAGNRVATVGGVQLRKTPQRPGGTVTGQGSDRRRCVTAPLPETSGPGSGTNRCVWSFKGERQPSTGRPHRARYTRAGCSTPRSTTWTRPSTQLRPHRCSTGPHRDSKSTRVSPPCKPARDSTTMMTNLTQNHAQVNINKKHDLWLVCYAE